MRKISVITINFNNADGLLNTIKSVQEQTYSNIEYIVIDGGSTDDSLQYIRRFSQKIYYWISEPDRGIYHAMNKGVRRATGEYCLFLNSGDVLHDKDVLANIAKDESGVDFLIGKVLFLNTRRLNSTPKSLTMKHFYKNSIPHPSTFIKTSQFAIIKYDESFRIVSDWKFFMEAIIFNNASYKFLDIIVTDFDTNGISATNKQLVELERYQVLSSLLPSRIYEDYTSFIDGEGYKISCYDRFFIKLRSYKYAKFIYFVSVLIMRCICVFRPGASFAKNYPLLYKNDSQF